MAQFKKEKKGKKKEEKIEIPLIPKSKKEIALDFYNAITGKDVDELPGEAWEFLCKMKKECMLSSLFLHHKAMGVSPGQLQIRYGVNTRTIEYHVYTAPKNRALKNKGSNTK